LERASALRDKDEEGGAESRMTLIGICVMVAAAGVVLLGSVLMAYGAATPGL